MKRDPKVSRRQWLAGMLGAPLIPSARGAAARQTANPDVAIVGAGVAGLAAAHALIAGGRSVLVLEALPRIGGRAYTDVSSIGVPWDRGAAYLEGGQENPLLAVARRFGFGLSPYRPAEWLYQDGKRASPTAQKAFERAYEELDEVLTSAGREGESDASAAWTVQSVGFANPWTATAAAHLMPLDYGLDAEDASARDWAGIEGGTNFAVGEGIGTLVQRLGEAIPVSLGAPVSQITRNRNSLTLTTPKGAITARAALITVSAPVLASGTIALKGVVPADVLDAAANITMGNLEKVALALTPDKAATYPANTLLIPKLRDERTYYVHMRPHGQPVAIYYAGGRWARTLAAMPLSGASAEARAALADILGSAALKAVTRASATNWAEDARFRGSYSAVKVNALPARLNLAKPFANDVFLAGEAMGERRAQSLDGAWWSGTRAAREILAQLRARQL